MSPASKGNSVQSTYFKARMLPTKVAELEIKCIFGVDIESPPNLINVEILRHAIQAETEENYGQMFTESVLILRSLLEMCRKVFQTGEILGELRLG